MWDVQLTFQWWRVYSSIRIERCCCWWDSWNILRWVNTWPRWDQDAVIPLKCFSSVPLLLSVYSFGCLFICFLIVRHYQLIQISLVYQFLDLSNFVYRLQLTLAYRVFYLPIIIQTALICQADNIISLDMLNISISIFLALVLVPSTF